MPIRVSTLRGDLPIPFDAFVKVGERYVHYSRAGATFSGERLDRLKAKQLKTIFIRSEDEGAYNGYLDASMEAAYDRSKPLEVRAEVIQGFQQAASEQFMENPTDEEGYKHVRHTVQRFVQFLHEEKQGAGALLKMKNTDHSITHHSVNVATLSTAMIIQSGLVDGAQLHLLALGCLLHDIDHFYNERFDVARPITSLSPDELKIYRAHPINGAYRFQGATFVDQTVMNIIAQHEEHIDGSGYPKGLRQDDMDPLVIVAATANAYDRLVSFESMSPKDALKSLLIDKMGVFPLTHLQSLQEILKTQGLI